MSAFLSPVGLGQQFFNDQGVILSGGNLYVYLAGTTILAATYTDNTQAVLNSNPLVLGSNGRLTQEIWLPAGRLYKFVLTDSTGAPLSNAFWDNVAGINDSSAPTGSEWQASNLVPTFVSTNSFSVPGFQTSLLHPGRRMQFIVTAGLVYGRILSSTFGATATTVTLVMDGTQVLDSGISLIYYSLLTSNPGALPLRYASTSDFNNYTATVGIASYNIGEEYHINIVNANTVTTPTLSLDGLGSLNIVKQDGSAVAVGQVIGQCTFRYDGTNAVLLNILPGAGAGGVIQVNGASPIQSSGGTAPTISIVPATAAQNGYMTSVYASKLDGIQPGAAVSTVTASAPVASSGGASPNISMPAATASNNGYMTAAQVSKLNSVAAAVPQDVTSFGVGWIGLMSITVPLSNNDTAFGNYMYPVSNLQAVGSLVNYGTWRNVCGALVIQNGISTFQRIA